MDKIEKKFIKNKHKVFNNERKDLLNKLYNILDITNNKKTFFAPDIEDNELTNKLILDLEPDIIKYYNVSTWPAFKKNKSVDRRVLSIVKSLFKDMNLNLVSSSIRINDVDNKPKYTTIYNILSDL